MKTANYRAWRNGVSALSLILFPVTFYYYSPVVPLAGAAAGVLTGSLIVFAALFVSALFLGRSFCSWVCPAGALQELSGESRTQSFPRRFGWIKYLVWTPWIVLLAVLFRSAGGVASLDFFYLTDRGISVSDAASLGMYLAVALVFFIFPLAFGKRAACHTLCWMAPFMVIAERFARSARIPGLSVKHGANPCVSCGKCACSCPMNIDIDRRAASAAPLDLTGDCILCGNCVQACPRSALTLGSREFPAGAAKDEGDRA